MNGKAKREAIKFRLEELAAGGILTPEAVVEDARDPDSPLHGEFNWDDASAAHQHRLDQARALIRSVRVTVRNETKILSTIRYVRNPDAEPKEAGYVRTVDLQTDRDRALAAIQTELGRVEAYIVRVSSLATALGLDEEVKAFLAQFAILKKRAKAA